MGGEVGGCTWNVFFNFSSIVLFVTFRSVLFLSISFSVNSQHFVNCRYGYQLHICDRYEDSKKRAAT